MLSSNSVVVTCTNLQFSCILQSNFINFNSFEMEIHHFVASKLHVIKLNCTRSSRFDADNYAVLGGNSNVFSEIKLKKVKKLHRLSSKS